MPSLSDLRQRQALPLGAKVLMSQHRIREWYNHFDGNVYVSFSGGKDSTVLAHLVHDIYPDVPLVFCNTGLEYPEIQAFARKRGAEFIRPSVQFSEVISQYGYPIISKEVAESIHYARAMRVNGELMRTTIRDRKELMGERRHGDTASLFNKTKWRALCEQTQFGISHMCCDMMKKRPFHRYQNSKKVSPILGTLAEESRLREKAWVLKGCNSYEGSRRSSQPLSFWTEQNILQYIKENNVEIASVYGEILAVDEQGFMCEPLPGVPCKYKCTKCQRTGCIFCGFGCYLEKGVTRFQMLAKTHPRQYEYCMQGGQWVNNPKYDPTAPERDGAWLNWNPKKIWVPSKKGLGMKKVFDDCNAIYGKDFIRYE